jgi:hypothetical protein
MYVSPVKGAQRLISVKADSADTQVVQDASVYVGNAIELVVGANLVSGWNEIDD